MSTTTLYERLQAAKNAEQKAAEEFDQAKRAWLEAGEDATKSKPLFEKAEELSRAVSQKRDERTRLNEMYAAEALLDQGLKADAKPDEGTKSDDIGAAVARALYGDDLGVKSPGERLIDAKEWKAWHQANSAAFSDGSQAPIASPSVQALTRPELKTLLTGAGAPGTSLLRNERLPGIRPLYQAPLQLAGLITVGDTDSNVVEWVRQTGFTNNAAEVAEATATTGTSGTKPESALTFTVESTTVRTIAHWIPATRQALSDIGQLRTIVDNALMDGVRRRLNGQILNGDGVAPNLRGILNTPGIGTQAIGADTSVDAIHRALTVARLAFFEPNAILMHPSDFEDIRLGKDANDNYYFGPPSVAGESRIWGMRVVLDTTISAGTALVGDFAQAVLYVREGVNVTATNSHSDFFVRNMVAILAEGRYALAVPYPAAFVAVTGI